MITVDPNSAFTKLTPDICAFVISIDSSGKPSGMIAGWFTRCSFDPPLLAVSLSKKGHTHQLIHQSHEFVIAVPNQSLIPAVEFFGNHHGNNIDKFQETKIKTVKAKLVRSPLIAHATINFECRLVKEVEAGDHIIYVGQVLAAHLNRNRKILFFSQKDNRFQYQEF